MEEDLYKHLELNSGLSIPQLAFGTGYLNEEVSEIIQEAIRCGYRHIDTGSIYGNESEIGSGIEELISKGEIKREDLFITTKLSNIEKREGEVMRALRNSLERLKMEYVDLYLVHWPMGAPSHQHKHKQKNTPLHIIWREMEDLVDKGLTRSIGISNFSVQLILDLMSYARIPPAVNQVEMHPYLSQTDLLAFCCKLGIVVEAYSSLGAPAAPLPNPHVKYLSQDPLINSLALKYEKTWAQIVLNWGLYYRRSVVIAKTKTPLRIKENLHSQDFHLQQEDYQLIDGLNQGLRIYDPKYWVEYNNIPIFS